MTAPVAVKTEDGNVERAIAWVRAIESGQTGTALAAFLTPDVIHEDMPNRFFPNGSRSDLAAMRAASARGQTVMSRQRYAIKSATGHGNMVAIELDWSAELAVPLGELQAGDELRAKVALFMEFRDGLICRQRDYCCYEPIGG
jgi:ketosteroid isomerase-like protein